MGSPMIYPVIVIGAGPAGLAVAAQLTERGMPPLLLERQHTVGSSWRQHYDRLHLHTVKELSHLPGLAFPDNYPRYPSRQQLVDYLEQYAQHFNLQPQFGREVNRIEPVDGASWRVHCTNGEHYQAQAVVLTTGVNRVPFHPHFTDEDEFVGPVVHSSTYRNADPYRGQRVAVVGMGNSGAEIALDLSENGVTTYLSVRGEVNIIPRDLLGRPAQVSAIQLSRLPTWLGDRIALLIRRLTIGNVSKYGLELSPDPPMRQLRTTGKTPMIDIGTLDHIRQGKIKVLPAIDHFTPRGAVFTNGEEVDLDAVILATGYRPQLESMVPMLGQHLDDYGLPMGIQGSGKLSGLYWIGFDNYTPGGTLTVIRRDAPRVAAAIATQLDLP